MSGVSRQAASLNGDSKPIRTEQFHKIQLAIFLYLQVQSRCRAYNQISTSLKLAEPLTCTVIYPFVNQLVRSTGITRGDEKKTGYYAGLTVGSLSCIRSVQLTVWIL